MKQNLIIVALCVLAFYGYQKFQAPESETTTVQAFTAADLENIPPSYNDSSPEPQALATPMTTQLIPHLIYPASLVMVDSTVHK